VDRVVPALNEEFFRRVKQLNPRR